MLRHRLELTIRYPFITIDLRFKHYQTKLCSKYHYILLSYLNKHI